MIKYTFAIDYVGKAGRVEHAFNAKIFARDYVEALAKLKHKGPQLSGREYFTPRLTQLEEQND